MFKRFISGLLGLMLLANSGLGLLVSGTNEAVAAPAFPPVHPAAAVRIAPESPGVHDAHWGEKDAPMVIEVKALQPGTNVLTGLGVQFSAPVIAVAELTDDDGNILKTLDTLKQRRAVFNISANPVQIPSDSWRKFYVYLTYIDNSNGKYPEGFHLRVNLLPNGFSGKYLNPKNHKWMPLKFVFNTGGPIFEAVLTQPQSDYTPEFKVTTLTTPPAQNVVAGETDFDWMYAEITNQTEEEAIRVTAVQIEDTLGDAGDQFDGLINAEIWADLDSNGNYETKVSNTENPYDTGALVETHLFNLINSFVVESSVKIALRSDVSITTPEGDTHTIRVSETTAIGNHSGANASGTYEGTGQTMTVVSHGLLSVAVDPGSPASKLLVGGMTNAELAVFRFSVTDEDQFLNELTITDDGDDSVVSTYRFYADRDGSGNPVSPFLAGSVNPIGGVATLNIDNGVVRLTEGTYTHLYIKADIATIDGFEVNNGDTVKVTIADPSQDVRSTGLHSAYWIYGNSSISQDTAEHRVYKTIPFVNLASDSPSGPLFPSPNTTIAKFNITADVASDVSLRNESGNQLVVKINTVINDYPDGVTSAVRLFDTTNNIELDDVQYVSFGSGANTTTVTFDFDQNDFWVSAGVTKKIRIEVDTLEFDDIGDLIVAWLDDNDPNNFSWGIDGAGNYATADITFRNDIYGHVLIKS